MWHRRCCLQHRQENTSKSVCIKATNTAFLSFTSPLLEAFAVHNPRVRTISTSCAPHSVQFWLLTNICPGQFCESVSKESYLRFPTNVVLHEATWEGGRSNEGGEKRAGDVDNSIGKELLLTDEANSAWLVHWCMSDAKSDTFSIWNIFFSLSSFSN